jgi:hypothetical protein
MEFSEGTGLNLPNSSSQIPSSGSDFLFGKGGMSNCHGRGGRRLTAAGQVATAIYVLID